MPQQLTPADVMVFLFGLVTIVRWAWDLFRDETKMKQSDHREETGILIQVRSDLLAHEASDRVEFRGIHARLVSMEGKIDRLIERRADQ